MLKWFVIGSFLASKCEKKLEVKVKHIDEYLVGQVEMEMEWLLQRSRLFFPLFLFLFKILIVFRVSLFTPMSFSCLDIKLLTHHALGKEPRVTPG